MVVSLKPKERNLPRRAESPSKSKWDRKVGDTRTEMQRIDKNMNIDRKSYENGLKSSLKQVKKAAHDIGEDVNRNRYEGEDGLEQQAQMEANNNGACLRDMTEQMITLGRRSCT